MNPRRLHKLTIFSMRCESGDLLIISATDYTIRNCCRGVCAKRLCLWFAADTAAGTTPLRLGLDGDVGLDRVRDEALVVRHVIHLLNLFRGWLLIAGEF